MPKSFSQYKAIYNNAILTQNANIAVDIPGSDIYFKANAVSQVCADVANDLDNVANNIFPASSSGAFLNKHGLNIGLTPMRGALPSIGTVGLLDNPETTTVSYVIDVNTTLTSSVTGTAYYVTENVSIPSGTILNTVVLPISSFDVGTGTSSTGDLTFDTTITIGSISVTTATVIQMTSGTNIESESEYSTRIYNYSQFPRGAGSAGDYLKWCYLGDANVTQDYLITATAGGSTLFPVIMGGSPDPNYYLDGDANTDPPYQQTPSPIDRSVTSTVINNVQNYVNSNKGVNDNPNVITCNTFVIDGVNTGIINVYPALSNGITLDSYITLPDELGGNIKVSDLIIREARRAIISTPPAGTYINELNNYYIPVSSIESSILKGLNNNNILQGIYASIITGVYVEYVTGSVVSYYIPLPNITDGNLIIEQMDGTFTAQIVYDVDTTNGIIIHNQAQP